MVLTVGAAILGGIGIGNAINKSKAAGKAADVTEKAGNKALNFQKKVYNRAQKDFRPYLKAGTSAMDRYLYEIGLKKKKPKGSRGYEASPMYRYAMETGVDQIEGSAASYGGGQSGATMEALEAKRRQLTSADTGDYFSRLLDLMSNGQNAAGQMGAVGANAGDQIGSTYTNIGEAQRNGIVDKSNALTEGSDFLSGWLGYNNPMEQYSQSYGGDAGDPMSATPWLNSWARG